jgi:deoxyribodipyrimidine photo-lyase
MSEARVSNFEPTFNEALRRLGALHPAEYARTRNALDGAVSGLSPYLAHGVISMRQAMAHLAQRHRLGFDDKLVFEFAWREFFHHVWTREGDAVLRDLRPAALWPGPYANSLPADLREGRTGVPAIDTAVRQLYTTGYLHNHARMWLASYVVHLRKVHWRAGADWMFGHLLDGDVPSNHLSWQWVAGTFSNKPYLFNAENVARHAPKRGFEAWVSVGTVIDQPYEALEQVARGRADVGPQPGVHPGVAEPALLPEPPPDAAADIDMRVDMRADLRADIRLTGDWLANVLGTRRTVELVHPWQLNEREEPSGPRLGVTHLPAHAELPWSEQRWRWVLQRMQTVTDGIVIGDLTKLALPARTAASACAAPMPGYDAALRSIATLRPAPRLMPNPEEVCRSFTAFYQAVKRSAPTLQHLLNRSLFDD